MLQYTSKREQILTNVEISFTDGYPQRKLWITFGLSTVFPREWGKISVFKAFFVDNSVDNVEKYAWEKYHLFMFFRLAMMQNVGTNGCFSG